MFVECFNKVRTGSTYLMKTFGCGKSERDCGLTDPVCFLFIVQMDWMEYQ